MEGFNKSHEESNVNGSPTKSSYEIESDNRSSELPRTLVRTESGSDFLTKSRNVLELLQNDVERNVIYTKRKVEFVIDTLMESLEKRRKELLEEITLEGQKRKAFLKMERRKLIKSHSTQDIWQDEIPNERLNPPSRSRRAHTIGSESYLDELNETRKSEYFKQYQAGTMRFSFDNHLLESVKTFGRIDSSLASALHSEASGLGLHYSVLSEEAQFNIVTRDHEMNESFLEEDVIEVRTVGLSGEKYNTVVKTQTTGNHIATFCATQPGPYEISVFVNSLELLQSPFHGYAYVKECLTFDSEAYLTSEGYLDSDGAFTVQKGEASALLTKSDTSSGALIFGSTSFTDGKHAWKVKFTSACPSVCTCIGVSSRTNVFDLDIEHTCSFELSASLSLRNGAHTPLRRTRSGRKSSIFERSSRTYIVFLDLEGKLLNVACCETDEDKCIILPDSLTKVYPCVYMTHSCPNPVCPRPIVAFT